MRRLSSSCSRRCGMQPSGLSNSKQFKLGLKRFTAVIIVLFSAGRGCGLHVKSGI